MKEERVSGGEHIPTPDPIGIAALPRWPEGNWLFSEQLRKLELPHPRHWLPKPAAKTTPDDGAKHRLGESYLALRQCLGFIGLLFPFVLIAFSIWDADEQQLRTSISAYYYSAMRDIIVGALVAIGLLLITYVGNYRWENVLSSVAGVGAIGVALLPTERQCKAESEIWFAEQCEVTAAAPQVQPDYFLWFATSSYPTSSEGLLTISTLHYASAGAFLLGVAALAYWAFVWTSDTHVRTPEKKEARNTFYRRCARVIMGCVALIGVDGVLTWQVTGYSSDGFKPVFWLEAIAVWAFALAWLVKGNLGDRRRLRWLQFFPSDAALPEPEVKTSEGATV